MFLLNVFFFHLWEPTFSPVGVFLYSEFGLTDNSFAIRSYRQLRRSSRMKEVCRKVENQRHKKNICVWAQS